MENLRTEAEIIKNWQDDITKPLVSVSCVTYNHEKYIREAIEGFLIQETNFPFQICILDDASTDNNVEIIKEYAEKYPKIFKCFFLEENTWGKPHRLEIVHPYLFKRREAKYIAMCDGDDYWTDPLKLQKLVDFLEKNKDFSGIHTNVLYVDKEGTTLGEAYRAANQAINKGFENFEDLVLQNTIYTCSFLFRLSALIYKGKFLWELSNDFNDIYVFLKVSLDGKIKYLDEITSAYRKNVGIMQTYTIFDLLFENNETVAFFLTLDLTKTQKSVCFQRLVKNYLLIFYMNSLINSKSAYHSLFCLLKHSLKYLYSSSLNFRILGSELFDKKLIKGLIYMHLPKRLRKRPYADWFGEKGH